MLTHLDLFSGIGGFALAARWAGFDTVAFCEKDEFCRKVLRKHWPDPYIFEDIKDFHWTGKVDLLTGGFPCQPFSVAGNKKGKDDDRYLWPEMLRIIRKCEPTWIIGENVPGIISYLDPILEDLEREGYSWGAFLIPASAVCAPHKRERLWIVAHRDSERFNRWFSNREGGYLQGYINGNVKKIQQEWSQFIPKSWKTFNAQDWLESSPDSNSEQCSERAENNETLSQRSQREKPPSKTWCGNAEFNWQKYQPPVPGVDARLPNRLDRNKSLGNAIVPQVVYPIMAMIKLIEESKV